MGSKYTNVCLKGADQPAAVALLDEWGRRARVSASAGGWVVVYDEKAESFDLGDLESLAMTLSKRLSCPAVAALNFDEDVLWLAAYEDGILRTRYASAPQYFEDAAEYPDRDACAEELCRLCVRTEFRSAVAGALRRGRGALGLLRLRFPSLPLPYVFETQRHQDLARLLGLPEFSVGYGFRYVRDDVEGGVAGMRSTRRI